MPFKQLSTNDYLLVESKEKTLLRVPKQLCKYLALLRVLVECENMFWNSSSKEDVITLEHCPSHALEIIFQFLEYYHENYPQLLLVDEEKNDKESKEGDKQFNDKWFKEILLLGTGALADTIRAAHFLYNEYLFQVLVNGCNSLLIQGSPSHIRAFLNIKSSKKRKRKEDKEEGSVECREEDEEEKDYEWIDWNPR